MSNWQELEQRRYQQPVNEDEFVVFAKREGYNPASAIRLYREIQNFRNLIDRKRPNCEEFNFDRLDVFLIYSMTKSGKFIGHCSGIGDKSVSLLERFLKQTKMLKGNSRQLAR